MDTISKSCKNKHLNAFECYKLKVLLKSKGRVLEIAKILCRDRSTIYREINQGTVKFNKSDWSVKKRIQSILFIEYKAKFNE